jgi:RND family efflux transporter MFP subunit
MSTRLKASGGVDAKWEARLAPMSDDLSSKLASLRIARDEGPPKAGVWKYLLAAVAVASAAIAGYVFGWPYLEARVFKAKVEVTEISVVSPAQAAVELTASGYVVPQIVSNIAVKVPGRVSKVFVRRGEEIKAGDVLFELDVLDQEAAIASGNSRVAAAQARVETARAATSEAKLQADREKALAAAGVAPAGRAADLEARVGSLQAQIKAAEAEVRAAAAEVTALKVNLKNFKIFAPINGTVLNKPPEVGEFVGPQPAGISVDMGGVEIADLDSLVIETDVPEQRLHLVKMGAPAEILLDAFPDRRHRGKVLEIVPRVNRAKATVTVKTGFVDPPEGALPDMAARVSFLASELDANAIKQKPKTVVPPAAVADRNGSKVVYVVDDGKVRMTSVTLGPPFGGGLELVRGPNPGTRLVKNPSPELYDGQRVQEITGE